MKFAKLLSLFLLLFITVNCSKKVEKAITPQIIPMPLSENILDGEFILSARTQIRANGDFKTSSTFLTEYLSTFNLKVSESEATSTSIEFVKDETIANVEAYILDISTEEDKNFC